MSNVINFPMRQKLIMIQLIKLNALLSTELGEKRGHIYCMIARLQYMLIAINEGVESNTITVVKGHKLALVHSDNTVTNTIINKVA